MRIEITRSKVESSTFLILRNALDLFRNVLDRCFIEITLSKVKSISFFLKNVLENHACLMIGLNQASWIFVTGIHTLFMALRIQIPDWEPTQNSAWSTEFKREMKGKSLDLRKTEMSMGSRAKNQAELGQRMNSMEHGASFQIMGNIFIKK